MVRLFLALTLPEDICAELIRVQNALQKLDLIDGSFVKKEDLHITLKFFGDIDQALVPTIIEKMESISHSPFEVSLKNLEVFSAKDQINFIYVAVESPDLFTLANAIEEAYAKIMPREQRPYRPHITVVKVKNIKNQNHFLETLKHMHIKPLSCIEDRFVLMQSKIDQGSNYRILHERLLKT